MSDEIRPFKMQVSDADLKDLKKRLRATRWPDLQTVPDSSQGIPRDYVQKICEYWAHEYDWRRIEARLNALPQFHTDLDGVGIYFLHIRSPQPDAAPLILTHGWPGSVIEFLKVIPALTDPSRHGGESQDAFHVICPALPGYSFSDKPKQNGWSVEKIAGAWSELILRPGKPPGFSKNSGRGPIAMEIPRMRSLAMRCWMTSCCTGCRTQQPPRRVYIGKASINATMNRFEFRWAAASSRKSFSACLADGPRSAIRIWFIGTGWIASATSLRSNSPIYL